MKLKKFLSLMLALVMLIGALPVLSAPVAATDTVNRDMFGNEISYYGRAALAQLPNAAVLLYAYDQLAAGYDALAEQITVYDGVTPLSREDYDTAFDAYMRDHAEQFWIPNSHLIYSNGTTVTKIEPKYTFTAGELSAAKAAFNIAANNLLDGVTASMSDYDIELLLHDRLAGEIAYVNADNAHNAYGALVEGEAVCEGYAEALQTLLHRAGVSAFLATGNSADPSSGYLQAHMWNYVCVDGAYYQTDLTWDDQGSTLYHAYFNQTDATMGEDHQLDAVAYSLPTCTATAANYFVRQDGMLDTYTVDSVAALLSAGNLTAHVYIPGDKDAFVTWYNTNIAAIAQAAGVTGGFSYSRRTLGREMVLTITPSTPTTTTTVITSTSRPTTTATKATTTTTTTKAADVTLPMVSFTSTSQVPTATSPTQTTLTTTVTAPEESGGLTYEIADGKVTITGYTGSATHLTIPATIEGYPVTAIGDNAFNNNDMLVHVMFPNTLLEIGLQAFYSCGALKEITIPDSVKTIGKHAFYSCATLQNVILGEGLTEIGGYAFSYCTALTNVRFSRNVTTIGDSAFAVCSLLEHINLPDNLTSIGSRAFSSTAAYNNENNWENDAFYLNRYLLQVRTQPEGEFAVRAGTKIIADGTFMDCSQLTNISLPEGLLTIGKNAFENCTAMTGLTLPSTLTSIGYKGFCNCDAITVVDIPDSVTHLGSYAFSSCAEIKTVTIGSGLTTIPENAFNYCKKMTSVAFNGTITHIGLLAFGNCKALTSFTLPEGLQTLDRFVFQNCTGLTTVTLPSTLTDVAWGGFYGCSVLADVWYVGTDKGNITFDQNNDPILNATWHYVTPCDTYGHDYAGATCTTPETCRVCGDTVGEALGHDYSDATCTAPQTCARCGDTIGEALGHTYDDVYDAECNRCGETRVAVPVGLEYRIVNDEVVLTGYTGSATELVIPSTIEGYPVTVFGTGSGEFVDCELGENVTNIVLPESLVTIREGALGNFGITELFIPKNVTNIEAPYRIYVTAFEVDEDNAVYSSKDGVLFNKDQTAIINVPRRSRISNYTIPSTVQTISDCAFYWCDRLTNIAIPDSVKTIEPHAFYCCFDLESVTFGHYVRSIGDYAFTECPITTVSLPDSLTEIGAYAFSGAGVKTIHLSASVTKIGENALSSTNLTAIHVNENNPVFCSVDGVLFNKDATTLVRYPSRKPTVSYEIPSGTISIEVGAFNNAVNLLVVHVPGTMTEIVEDSFRGCTNLREIVLSEGVTVIGASAFSGCTSLATVSLPDSLQRIEWRAFEGTALYQNAANWQDGFLCIEDWLICADRTVLSGEIAIPAHVRHLAEYAFDTCHSITGVIFPNGVTTLSYGLFCLCDELAYIILPESVTRVEYIMAVPGIKDVWFAAPDRSQIFIHEDNNFFNERFGVTLHYNTCMNGHGYSGACDKECDYCDWTRTVSVEHIYTHECDSLCDVCGTARDVSAAHEYTDDYDTTCNRCETPRECDGDSDFYGEYTYQILPSEEGGKILITEYNGLPNTLTIPEAINGYPVIGIGRNAFSGCESLVNLSLPSTLRYIESRAFYGCSQLATIIIPNGVVSIGEYAFTACVTLTNVSIPASASEIGYSAFAACTSLENILVDAENETYTDVDGVLFSKHKSVLIAYPAGKKATAYTVPDTVIRLEQRAFFKNDYLTSITLSADVTHIGENAFSSCDNLDDIWYFGTETERDNIEGIADVGGSLVWHCNTCAAAHTYTADCDATCDLCDWTRTVSAEHQYHIPGANQSYHWLACDCGEVDQMQAHTYNNLCWGDDYHWYECDCGAERLRESHSYYNACDTDCNDCGAIREVPPHVYEYPGSNSVNHWIECYCGAKSEVEPHVFDIEKRDVYGHWTECDCGKRSQKEQHTLHPQSDDTHHWSVCECGYVSVKSPHNYKNFKFDDLKHWHECDCGAIDTENVYGHGYSPNFDDDAHWLECFCGHTLEEREPHVFDRTESNDTHHWIECTCGKVASKTAHTYNAGVVTKAATCKVTGVKTYTCTGCGATKTETIAKKAHSYNAATCTKAKTCKVCGVTSGSKLGHSYKKYLVKATTSKDGKDGQKCERCGYVTSTTKTIKYAKTFKLSATSYTYNGAVKTPTVTVKDSAGKTISSSNYTVTYASGRKNVGTYKVTVTMKGNYTGSKVLTFKINPISISKCKVSLSATSYTYNGAVKTPTVTVKNASGTKLTNKTHYTVTYASGRKNVGTYKVTVKMKGNYTGTKVLTFTIKPKAASINTLTAKSKALSVKLNRQLTQSTGYQIQYSTSKSFKSYKTKTITSYKTSTTTLTGLKAKTTYYVRVRTYKTVGGTKIYSNWSSYKYKKTK